MSLKTIVKVSHISNLSDARYCAGMGVEMLGFRMIPGTERYMAPEVFQDIRGWISGPKIIGELYGLSDPKQIETVMQTYAPDYVEVSYDEFKIFGESLPLPCIVYFPVTTDIAFLQNGNSVSYIIVDENTSCQEIPLTNIPILINTSSHKKVDETLAEGCFKGFVLEGPEELRPGITNFEKLGAILEALEEDY